MSCSFSFIMYTYNPPPIYIQGTLRAPFRVYPRIPLSSKLKLKAPLQFLFSSEPLQTHFRKWSTFVESCSSNPWLLGLHHRSSWQLHWYNIQHSRIRVKVFFFFAPNIGLYYLPLQDQEIQEATRTKIHVNFINELSLTLALISLSIAG